MKPLYFAYVRSKIDYCGPGWQLWLSPSNIEFMESMFRRQIEKSIVLKPVLGLYWQGITQNKELRDYKKLKHIVENFLQEQLLRRNQAADFSRSWSQAANASFHEQWSAPGPASQWPLQEVGQGWGMRCR